MKTVLIAILSLGTLAACQSVPLKQRVSTTHQIARSAVVEADDAERRLCQPAPSPASNHCTNPVAASVGLTDAKHQELSRKFAEVYRLDIAAGNAIVTWRAGDPVPTSVQDFLAAAHDLLTVSQSVQSTALATRLQAVVARAQALADVFLLR